MARDLITGLLNLSGVKESLKKEVVYLDIELVYPSLENFYSMKEEDILKMARAIEAVGEIKQPLLVKRTGTDVYEVIAGHKRRAGAMYLINEGKEEYRDLPCIIEEEGVENELALILTNSTQRELSAFEKMKQIEILKNYLEKNAVQGNKREIISELMNISKSEIGRLENINKNLTEPLKEAFESGKIATGTANEIASMSTEQQQKVDEIIKENGTIKMGEVKAIKEDKKDKEEDKPIEGQMQIEQYTEVLTDEMKQEIVERQIESERNSKMKRDIVNVSDSEFMDALENTWKKAHRDYQMAIENPDAIPKKTFLKMKIIKEAMDMYRSNYKEEQEVENNGF